MANNFTGSNSNYALNLNFDLNNPQHAAVVALINGHITSLIADALVSYFADAEKRASLPSAVQKDLLNLFNTSPELVNYITSAVSGMSSGHSSSSAEQLRFNHFEQPSFKNSDIMHVSAPAAPSKAAPSQSIASHEQVVFKSVKTLEPVKKDFPVEPAVAAIEHSPQAQPAEPAEPQINPQHIATLQSGLSIFGVKNP